MAKRAKNQDLLQWALAGARERLTILTREINNIYQTFPHLRGGRSRGAEPAAATHTAAGKGKRRRMSAAGRAKLRAAAKRRWAEAKKAGKKRLG